MSTAYRWAPGADWMLEEGALMFFCPGIPVAQGSKRHVGRGVMVEASKDLAPWREALIFHARAAANGNHFWAAVRVELRFDFPRPKAHFGTGRNAEALKRTAPLYKRTAPDLDKLARAVLDALTHSGVLRDDALVVELHCSKQYADDPGVSVKVRPEV